MRNHSSESHGRALNPDPAGTTAPESDWMAALARFAKTTSSGYSIRVATNPGKLCGQCGEPICDMCLLEGCHELGMVLAVIAVARAYASVDPHQVNERREALEELGAFVRIYERFAAKSGPPRRFRVPRQEGDSASN